METTPSSELVTSYHEAGHVVACHVQGGSSQIECVSVRPDETNAGRTFAEAPWTVYGEDDDWLSKEIVALFAGWAAASLIVSEEEAAEGCGGDDEQAAAWLAKLPTGAEQRLREQAKVLTVEHRTIIERISRELMDHESLDDAEIDICFEIEAGEATERDLAVYRAHRLHLVRLGP